MTATRRGRERPVAGRTMGWLDACAAEPIAWKSVNEQAREGAVLGSLDCGLDGPALALGALDRALTVAKV